MPKDPSLHKILVIGSGPIVIGQGCEFDYSGVQACKALKEEGYEVVLVNSNPATIMTDPGVRAPDLYRADHAGSGGENHRGREARRAPAHARRADGVELFDEAPRSRRAREIQCAHDRRQARGHLEGRRSSAFQGRDDQDRPRCAALEHCAHDRGRAQGHGRDRHHAAHHPPRVHARRRRGGGIAYNREEFETIVARGLDLSPGQRSTHRGIAPRLEGIRDGGHARQGGQLRDHLLDRKHRPDGRAHRRFHHRGPDPDDHRPRVSAHARRQLRRHPRDRRRDRRLEHSVCRRPKHRADDRHRDEPACFAQFRTGVEGHRLPHRQDRRPAGRGLHPRRDQERHHPRDPRELRADHRLRCRQSPALHLRKIPASRPGADHADEERRRSDGHRPHVQGSAAKGAALTRNQTLRAHRRWRGQDGCR